MLGQTLVVGDDRRSAVPLLRLRALRSMARTREDGSRVLAARLSRFILVRGKRFSFAGLVTELFLAASVMIALLGAMVFFGVLGPVGLLGILVAIPAAIGYFTRETGERKYRRELAASYVAEGICGSCGYSLRGLHPEEDRRVTCPECGAGWRADRVVAPVWESSGTGFPTGPSAITRWVLGVESATSRMRGDAHGRLVPVADVRLRLWDAPRRGEIEPERLSALRSRLWRLGLTWRLMLLISALIPGSAFVGLVVMWVRGSLPVSHLGSGVMLALGIVALALTLVGLRGSRFAKLDRMAAEIVGAGLCPSCGKELRGGRRLDVGKVVCAGCAATWRAA